MPINKLQFCNELLNEYFKPGGPILLRSQLNDDIYRPLIKANITQGFKLDEKDYVEIELSNVSVQAGDNLFSQECFEFNCFIEDGIDTVGKNASDICYVDYLNKTIRMNSSQRAQLNLDCLKVGSNIKYFVRGNKDINNAVYLVDIGTVNPINGVFTSLESNVPFYSKEQSNKLYAKSTIKISEGIKAGRIKKITPSKVVSVGFVYGQSNTQFFFPHTQLQNSRQFIYEHQKIKVEHLSFNLLLLCNFSQNINNNTNQIIYRNNYYSTPIIENSIIQSAQKLIESILTEDEPQVGSIPEYILSFTNNENDYNSLADNLYNESLKPCFEVGCFDGTCFEEIVNNNLLNRAISNKGCCWLLLFLSSYSVNYDVDVKNVIVLLIEYLLRQKDDETLLFYNGWKNKEIEECVQIQTEDDVSFLTEDGVSICSESESLNLTDEDFNYILTEDDEFISLDYLDEVNLLNNDNSYLNSLELDKNLLTSTNVCILLALLKSFEITQDFKYIYEADNLYNNITKLLISNNLYKHSFDQNDVSIESIAYQLVLQNVLEDFTNADSIINYLGNNFYNLITSYDEEILVGSDIVYTNSDITYINIEEDLSLIKNNSLFKLTTNDNKLDLNDIYFINYLLFSNLKYLDNKISIDYFNLLEEKYESLNNEIIKTNRNTPMISTISCLINDQSFIEFDNLKFNSITEFYKYRFEKTLTYNKLITSLPTDYGWFNPAQFYKKSNISNLLLSLSNPIALINTEIQFWVRVNSLDYKYGNLLNITSKEYNLQRYAKESDELFRIRIKEKLTLNNSRNIDLSNNLLLSNNTVKISDNYKAILGYESLSDNLINNWGEGYIAGSKFNTNNITITFEQPIETDVYESLQDLKPIATNIELIENLSFIIGRNKSTSINIIDTNGSCDNLLLENNNDYLLEDGSRLCLENN